jgi:hypothetical protein
MLCHGNHLFGRWPLACWWLVDVEIVRRRTDFARGCPTRPTRDPILPALHLPACPPPAHLRTHIAPNQLQTPNASTVPVDYLANHNNYSSVFRLDRMHVRVVALCQGRGGESSSYKPQRLQWWNRRDALVRCTSTFLCGPTGQPPYSSRELILIHEDDYACVEMRNDGKNNTLAPPTEERIVTLWKSAASRHDETWIRDGDMNVGIACRIKRQMIQDSSVSQLPSFESTSKRKVLFYLQKHCSIEFLRENGLNSKPEVVLRKTNKKELMEVWREWSQKVSKPVNSKVRRSEQERQLKRIFRERLQPVTSGTTAVVAVLLHESASHELPCFGSKDFANDFSHPNLQFCFFLGAVRDMHPWENRLLETCCREMNIKLVRARLGPVPEFTSKILGVVAFHDANHVLGRSLMKLAEGHGNDRPMLNTEKVETPGKLHIVCSCPFSSEALTSELSRRSRAIWSLIRVTVCALWRSRVASTACCLENALSLVFQDGFVISVHQDELIALAEKHQAAPCEHQVLEALCRKRDEIGTLKDDTSTSWDSRIERIMQGQADWLVLDTANASEDAHLVIFLYSMDTDCPSNTGRRHVLALLQIQDDPFGAHSTSGQLDVIRHTLGKLEIPIVRQALVCSPVQDMEASTVMMIQHFLYQNRLILALERCRMLTASPVNELRKRKRHRKKEAKLNKKKG